jgi:hypothetical protein
MFGKLCPAQFIFSRRQTTSDPRTTRRGWRHRQGETEQAHGLDTKSCWRQHAYRQGEKKNPLANGIKRNAAPIHGCEGIIERQLEMHWQGIQAVTQHGQEKGYKMEQGEETDTRKGQGKEESKGRGQRTQAKPPPMPAGCQESPPHYGTNRYIKREVRTELRITQLLLVGFLWKKAHSEADVVTDLCSWSVVTLSSPVYPKKLGTKTIFHEKTKCAQNCEYLSCYWSDFDEKKLI